MQTAPWLSSKYDIRSFSKALLLDLSCKGCDIICFLQELDEALANVPAVVSMLRSVQDCFGEERRGICKFRHWSSI
jgi:hypothetical protein